MRLVFTSYVATPGFKEPREWLKRIDGYVGILESLAGTHEVRSIERIDYEGEHEINEVRYFFIRLNPLKTVFPYKMHRQISSWSPDVVFVNGFIFPLQIIQLRWHVGSKTKIIILHRAERPFRGIKKMLQVIADRCVNYYFFVSSAFGREWQTAGIIRDPKKICEIIQASSSFKATSAANAKAALGLEGKKIFLWVGRLDANKDPVNVVKGFLAFAESQPSATLYMIYQEDTLLEDVAKIIRSSNIGEAAVKLVGPVAHQMLGQWYNAADFFISGSHYEGSGVSVIEAMSCGCIPVLTDIISFRKITGMGQYGLLYEAGNAIDLQSKLRIAMDMDIEKEKQRIRRHFQQEFSYEAIAAKINMVIAGEKFNQSVQYAGV